MLFTVYFSRKSEQWERMGRNFNRAVEATKTN